MICFYLVNMQTPLHVVVLWQSWSTSPPFTSESPPSLICLPFSPKLGLRGANIMLIVQMGSKAAFSPYSAAEPFMVLCEVSGVGAHAADH
jgi:hypothetical protein